MDTTPRRSAPASAVAGALAELSTLMLAVPSVQALLDELAQLAARAIAPPAHCGIRLHRNHAPLTVASSDGLAAHADEAQYAAGGGPCLQSMRTQQSITVDDLADEQRWGAYPADALGYGVRSSLSLPLSPDGDVRGALNLYATVPSAFGNEECRAAELFTTQASAALTIVARMAGHVALADQLRRAIAGRSVIDQALGVLMGQETCDSDHAFGLLRSASQHQNRKLRDIAADIVRAVSGREPQPGPFREPS
jgi:GAF domain-containing protein